MRERRLGRATGGIGLIPKCGEWLEYAIAALKCRRTGHTD
jgi:hypothetical protein